MTATQIYTMVVYAAEEIGYWAEIAELAGCVVQDETIDGLKDKMREALEEALYRRAVQWGTWTGVGA